MEEQTNEQSMQDDGSIKLVTALSTREDPIDAALQVADRIKQQMESAPSLLMVFATIHHSRRMGMIADTLRDRLGSEHMLGITASGVVSGSTEIEDGPGLSVIACRFPGVGIKPFWIDHLSPRDSVEERAAGLADRIGATQDMKAAFFFADPFSVPLVKLIPALSASRVQVVSDSGRVDSIGTIIGGMASAGTKANTNTLLLDGEIRNSGAMGVTLSGNIQVDTIVSQGCRPIGQPMVITKARGNLILELAGANAVDAIRGVVQGLNENDKQLLGNGLVMGRVINESKSHFGRGDFLIRNIMGGDETSGAVAVADLIHAGQTIQLHLHDDQTAREDLSLLLDGQRLYSKPAGALLISCTSRGSQFFGDHGHDANAIHHAFDKAPDGATLAKSGTEVDPNAGIPVSGFFASGEIGPVDNQIFQHGHTAVVALFRQPE
ncbi:MAG: FIST N-terminal domain-containing protein [Phycisphaerales bacterium]|nr:FIST N-terminal domain-containing protein [Phycisphaerales bacterium]